MPLRFGKRIYRLESVPSTQDSLKEQFLAGAPAGSIAIAAEQSLGRGRRGRSWDSPAGKGLWASVLIEPSPPEEQWTWTPLWAALVAKKSIDSVLSENDRGFKDKLAIKWPNDLILQERKLGGILAENVQDRENRRAIIVGMGINLLQREEDFPPHLRNRSISLLQATGETYSPERLLESVIFSLEEMYSLIDPICPETIDKLWLESAWGWKENLRVFYGNKSFEGKFIKLGPQGEIGLENNAGGVEFLASAEGIQKVVSS
jgi:BirA family transcriptional regulator, biotin operon repressor / biotin---[acetyl-CoA-carboxylase] ligase